MSDKTDLTWALRLPEVGSPIRNGVLELEFRAQEANKQLEQALKRHNEAMAAIAEDAKVWEREIASLWTPSEIQEAKGVRA